MKGLRNHLCNGKLMLTPLMLTAILFSCKKENLQEQSFEFENADNQLAVVQATTTPSPNIIFQETFEGSDPFYPNYDLKERFANTYSFTQVTSPVFADAKSGRFELRDVDELSSGTRAEIRFPIQTSLHRWHSFAVYFPSADYQYDNEDDVISQWHQGAGYSPSISLRTWKDRVWLYVKPTPTTTDKIDLGPIVKDKWNTFVFNINHSSGSDGLLELWLNGSKVVNRAGANMYRLSDGFEYPRYNIGIYKSAWNGTNTSDTKKRVLYYDNIKLGNENATLIEMTPGVPATPPSTSPSTVTGFTLVSAHTEKDIIDIADGASFSLAQIADAKLNIRANTASAVGSIKFELSGAQSKTSTDSKVPYALHGDDGLGNYYYGNWNPPAVGTYTIKATPYSGAGATGTAGTPYSIRFTVTN